MSTENSPAARVAVALLHHPVYDKHRQVVTTAVTNLDLHDIARAAKTFGLCRYFVVTPVADQQALAERIRVHWLGGWGAGYNPRRKEALELLRVLSGLEDAIAEMTETFGTRPLLVVTGAKGRLNSVTAQELRAKIESSAVPMLILFGTGWGMTEEVFDQADFVLEPISGNSEYNHLSVRSAVSIYLDRLFGR
ncbi:RNA methyltransferase [Geobacter pelophilus]|uniref:RNA methyltransferase n=1 Tax=Geoanaerobacter pelophilus TaxID=60036 RepID=A0AAW4KWX2_9BACT|nr:RNA methyltransferase [Geoanaerobacter pelophilus]MBT0663214.1 RNA methyltransferase [Geoanaerobacter pelophilus]